MKGGDGSDTYIVDNIGDVVAESFNDSLGGVDTVLSSVSYSIAPGTTSGQQGYGIENLALTGSGNINATGNGNNNTITGNSGNNTLNGGVGNDSLIGGDGNDSLIGGDGNDSLVGGVGNDSLTGGLGIDTLWGNQGADKFIFNSLSEGIDIIKDFQWTEGDVIQVSALGFGASSLSQFSYNTSTGALFFDPFGSVGPTQFATIENKPAGFSTNIDIVLV
jgi:Ca2+-binding RTX toxin-like protein